MGENYGAAHVSYIWDHWIRNACRIFRRIRVCAKSRRDILMGKWDLVFLHRMPRMLKTAGKSWGARRIQTLALLLPYNAKHNNTRTLFPKSYSANYSVNHRPCAAERAQSATL
ncbi:hypothetical protein SDJN03_14077, partial [Cucurbita argyrosperma subsp. sororia]